MKQLSLVIIGLILPFILYSQTKTCKLSEMEIAKAYQQHGAPVKNKSVTAEELKIAGTVFTDGVGTHALSKIKLNLNRNAKTFTGAVGINDHTINYKAKDITSIPLTDGTVMFYRTTSGEKQFVGIGKGNGTIDNGSAVFRIVGDGKELFNSGLMKGGIPARELTLDLSGIDVLELITEPGSDGNSGDHTNWLNVTIGYVEIARSESVV